MQFNPGTGGSVTATSLENQFYTIIAQLQAIERDNVKNPNEANIVTSTLDQDEFLFSGTCTIYEDWVGQQSVERQVVFAEEYLYNLGQWGYLNMLDPYLIKDSEVFLGDKDRKKVRFSDDP